MKAAKIRHRKQGSREPNTTKESMAKRFLTIKSKYKHILFTQRKKVPKEHRGGSNKFSLEGLVEAFPRGWHLSYLPRRVPLAEKGKRIPGWGAASVKVDGHPRAQCSRGEKNVVWLERRKGEKGGRRRRNSGDLGCKATLGHSLEGLLCTLRNLDLMWKEMEPPLGF